MYRYPFRLGFVLKPVYKMNYKDLKQNEWISAFELAKRDPKERSSQTWLEIQKQTFSMLSE